MEESSIIAMEDNQLIHLVHGTYMIRNRWRNTSITSSMTYKRHALVLYEHVSQEGLISITKEERKGDDSKFFDSLPKLARY